MKTQRKKTVFITGGSRGIGLATVRLFKEHGWNVATCATRMENLKDNPADLQFSCQVSNPQEIKSTLEQIVQHWGQIDALVNNAGLAGTNSLEPSSDDQLWHDILNVNLHGTYYVCKYGAAYLPDQTGRVINIASVLALRGVPDATAYCAAKHAVLGFTRALAQHLAPRKITVNAICPGWTKTDMAESRMKEIGLSEPALNRSVPLGRMVEPKEVADLIYYLASSEGASMMTGQALTIDGGSLGA
ncbi:MAG: SDR family NAD(P)-dependent oxidoreductase [Bdellovibrionia bacterium]